MKKHKGSMISYLNKSTQAAKVSRDYVIKEIEVSKIIKNEKNFYSIEGIEEMANSLAVSRHIPPLEVIANKDGTYRLISGERRLSATLLRIKRGEIEEHSTLPCHVLPDFEADDTLTQDQQEMLAVILANNYRDKSPLDKLKEVEALEPIARSIYETEKATGNLKEDGKNLSFRAFFAKCILDVSEAALHRLKSLSKLTSRARQALADRSINKSVAEQLATYPNEVQDDFIHRIEQGEIQGSLVDLTLMRSETKEDDFEHLEASKPKEEEQKLKQCEETPVPMGRQEQTDGAVATADDSDGDGHMESSIPPYSLITMRSMTKQFQNFLYIVLEDLKRKNQSKASLITIVKEHEAYIHTWIEQHNE